MGYPRGGVTIPMSSLKTIARTLAGPLTPLVRRGARAAFVARGKRPWSFGYTEYKRQAIVDVLRAGSFDPARLPEGFGHRLDERIVEYPWCMSRLPAGPGALLDAGSALNHDFILDHDKLANKKLTILTLAPEPACYWQRGISYVFDDLRHCAFRADQFDTIACLSTLEHVGLDNTRLYTSDPTKKEADEAAHLEAVRELARILKPGGSLLLTVPFGIHENGGWYQVFDGKMVDRLIATFAPSRNSETYFRYTPGGWISADRETCRTARYHDVNQQTELAPDCAAASGAVVCLELEKPC